MYPVQLMSSVHSVTVTAAGQTGLGAPLAHPSTESRDLQWGSVPALPSHPAH